ncbi:hypothetical protein CC85DRAFT_329080 [Cutaneotrichosporon oleaginosum]|uniref:RanBP2-type domain-containing protein n=1 Tax=Cutaneotrichosporon oleaginosum TaxID=879819 RepID=A0A0J1B162_9TREE|nr:uncharacterized protein CC85DRAFT_329080 [Cutaneotrichosporon oleaginosum]KLT41339.1 hypothetical protein CC85DRAFT_329080 [Cutaneotrichosporon oleaginosum]TXT06284.1 hypothetical protein COLE_05615 [Cutaneotrichosporon oleaginosum]
MNRGSSRKDLRSERISNTPYRRNERPVAKQTSWFSNLTASITSTLSRFRSRDGSVSGSEDEWGGEGPAHMAGQDMFSLAEAAGRGGEEFAERAAAWRQSKHMLAKHPSPPTTSWNQLDLEPKRVRPSASMPSFQPYSASSNRNTLFQTPSAQVDRPNGIPGSASSAALQALIASKAGGQYTAQDIASMEALLRSVKAETMASQPTGGWSGALTTIRAAEASTPGSGFSVGSPPPANRSVSTPRARYLGPGMSPRRFNMTTGVRSLSNLFDDDTSGKRRKTLPEVEVEMLDDETSNGTSRSTREASAASKAAEYNQDSRAPLRAALRPSPLAQSSAASPEHAPTPRDIGRKRVNDLIQDVLENEILPHEERPAPVFNPYEASILPAGKHYSPYASLRHSSSESVNMRRSLSASRGAAAKLDSERMKASTSGRPLSTLDLINRGRPSPAQTQRTPAQSQAAERPPKKQKKVVDEPIVTDDDDELSPPKHAASTTPSSTSAFVLTPSRRTPAAVTIEEPEPVSAFPTPSLSQSTRAKPPPAPKPVAAAPVPSTSDSIIAASKPASAPAFSTQHLGLGPPPIAPAATPSKSRTPKLPEQGTLYMSAKDTALNVDKNTLPFYTFTLPPGSDQPQPSVTVKGIVSAGPPKTDGFAFEISNTAQPTSYYSPPAASTSSNPLAFFSQANQGDTWKCDVCMLKNTAANTEKCGVCEAPKPGAKAATASATPTAMPSAPSGGFGGFTFKPPAKPEGVWTCDVCMLQNTAADTVKCSVCEAPKPGSKPAASTPAASAPPAAPFVGFDFGGAGLKPPAKSAGEWDCDVCSLKNPATATEKCTICEAPKPGANAAGACAPAPASASTPPTSAAKSGFKFVFGSKPDAPGDWTCDTCMLKNPASATEKCSVCETPKPGVTVKAAAKPALSVVAPAGGFSFGGQTFAAPTSGSSLGGQSSSTGPASAPAAPSSGFSFGGQPFSAAAPTSTPSAVPAGGFSFGGQPFWTGPAPPAPTGAFSLGVESTPTRESSGFKPPPIAPGGFSFAPKPAGGSSSTAPAASPFSGFGGFEAFAPKEEDPLGKPIPVSREWTCYLCGLLNPGSAKLKCEICEAPKAV